MVFTECARVRESAVERESERESARKREGDRESFEKASMIIL